MNLLVLLKFLINNCALLFTKYKFVIVNSELGPTHVSGASVTLDSEDVRIFLTIEREEILMSFTSLHEKGSYGFNHVFQLLGHQTSSENLNNELDAAFLARNLDEIMKRFNRDQLAITLQMLKKIKAGDYAIEVCQAVESYLKR